MKTWKASDLLDHGGLHKARSIVGISTGIDSLDAMTRGLPIGLVLLAGRPSSGDEVLARQIALNVCRAASQPVLWFSTQLNAAALVGCLLSHSMADQVLADNPALIIIDAPRLTMSTLRAKLDELLELRCDSQGLVIVDELETLLKSCPPGKNDQTEIAHELRGIALAHNLSLMVRCGLSRKLEERKSKMPRLCDLNAIAPFVLEADQVMATHYPHHYDPAIAPENEWLILVLKNRNGQIGGVSMSKTMLPWPAT